MEGIASFLRKRIYMGRKAVIIEKSLQDINNHTKFFQNSDIKLIDITGDFIKDKNHRFLVKNRYLRALEYLNKGYGGHALVRLNDVIGDVWYSPTIKPKRLAVHPDIARFGIETSKDYAYSFDQFLVPSERGNNVATALLSGQAHALREKGYSKVLGYYWADNLPAVWNARVMNKYREVRTLKVYRFIFFEMKFIIGGT